MLAIETRGLTRRFGTFTAVDGLDLKVAEGEIFGLLGLNGAGKSTTIKMLCGLLPPTSGEARVLGHDVEKNVLDVRGLVGLLGDDGGESRPSWSAREFLDYFATLSSLPAQRIDEVLDLVALEPEWRKRPMGSYSTGMRRRVELARALLPAPRVLFLDEPTRGLDLPGKRAMWRMMQDLAATQRVTILVSSHEVNEIQALCRRVAVMHKGRLTFDGNLSALGSDPKEFEERLVALLEGAPQPTPVRRTTQFEVVTRD